jgi:hypothetical protein
METVEDVEVLHLDGDRKPVPLVRGPSAEGAGAGDRVVEAAVNDGAQRRPMRSKGRFRIGYSRQPA